MALPTSTGAGDSLPERWPLLDPRYSLRARSAIVFGSAALLLTVLSCKIGGDLLRGAVERHAAPLLEFAARQTGEKLERSAYERYVGLQLAAATLALQNAAEPEALQRFVETVLDASPGLAWVGYANAEGTVIAATQRVFEGARVTDRPWFRGAQQRAWIGQVQELPELARSVAPADAAELRFVDIAAPLHRPDGSLAGVLGAYVRWSGPGLSENVPVPESLRRENTRTTIYNTRGEPLFETPASSWNQPADAPAPAASGQARGSLIETGADGAGYLTGYVQTRGFGDFRGVGWIVAVRQPLADLYAPVKHHQRTTAAAGGVLTLAMAVLGWLATAPISRQLRRIALAAGRIRSGDILAILPAGPGRSELARACSSLRNLVESLRERREDSAGQSPGRTDRTT